MKMFLRFAWVALILALSSTVVHARRVAPLFDPARVELKRVDGQPATVDQVRTAILNGAKMNGAKVPWTIRSETPGAIMLTYSGGTRFEAVIQVDYDHDGYQVHHASSIGLRYASKPGKVPTIHSNYNRWIQDLLNNARIPGELEPVKIPSPKDKDDKGGDDDKEEEGQ